MFFSSKNCVLILNLSSTSSVVGKNTTKNSSVREKMLSKKSDLGIFKTQTDDKTPTQLEKLMIEGDEDMPKSSKRLKHWGIKQIQGKVILSIF